MFFKRKKPVNLIEHDYGKQYHIDLVVGRKTYRDAMKCVLYKENSEILIADIYVGDTCGHNNKYLLHINKGYGTLMMNKLLAFAKRCGYKRIVGNLSDVDENSPCDKQHRERQIHFYRKFGFTILPDEKHPQAIELNLSDSRFNMRFL